MADSVLTAPHVLEYPYTRSVGPVLGRFFAALRDRRVVGVRARDGRVLVPPQEFDPATAEPLDEFVEVGQGGIVTAWAWVSEPRPKHPLQRPPSQRPPSQRPPSQRPFAWALVRLDGADTAMLHALDAGDESAVRTGMRVRVRWRDETQGDIHDIACFEAEAR